MPTTRRYLVNLDAGGRIIIIRSDGGECSQEEKQWVADCITNVLKSNTPNARASLPADEFGTLIGRTHFGVEFQLDPFVVELDARRNRKGYTKKRLAELLLTTPQRVSDWVRGRARPHLEDLRDWGVAVEVVPVLIPTAILNQVLQLKKEYDDREIAELPVVIGDEQDQ